MAPTQLAYRTARDIGVLNASPIWDALQGFVRPEGNLRCCFYSPDSRYFAWASPEQVLAIDTSTGQTVAVLPVGNVFELGFSPLGTYIITWQRPSKDEDGNAISNLKVWRTLPEGEGHTVVGQFVQKSQTGWNLQYTADERFCARAVTNEVHFYEASKLMKVWNRLRVEGVSDFMVSPGKNPAVAIFVPVRKGSPAAVKVFQVPQFASPVSQKTFFKGDKVQLKWNHLGTSLIVLAQTDVDKTNKSYYGETNMYILSANGSFDARINLDKEGPIHDVAWSPNSKEFGVVYGYMPSKTTIFNARAFPNHHFDLAPRNTILFSPHGRFVLVAGFGNLAGQMDIYDLGKGYSKVCTIQASNCTLCEWSPDGRHILTATTSPRLRVDNGIRVWHIGGKLMYNEDVSELYHVCWRPEPAALHPLPASVVEASDAHASAHAYLEKVKSPSKPAGAYRPPGARGTSTPLHFKREDEGGAAHSKPSISSTFAKPRRRDVPGAEFAEPIPAGAAAGGGVSLVGGGDGEDGLSKSAMKNKKKRDAKKAKESTEKGAGLSADTAIVSPPGSEANPGRSFDRRDGTGQVRSRSKGRWGSSNGRSSSQQRGDRGPSPHRRFGSEFENGDGAQPSRQRAGSNLPQQSAGLGPPSHAPAPIQTLAPDAGATPDVTITSPGGGAQDRKVRSLLKKIRAIEDLKMRQSNGEKLEDTQVKKIGTEETIRKELADLDQA